MAELEILTGPGAGTVHQLSKTTTLGRSARADIQIDDQALSRKHAQLVRDEKGGFILQDLGSHNGTYVNSTRIRSCALHEGDRLRAGRTSFVFRSGKSTTMMENSEETGLNIFEEADTSSTVVDTLAVDSVGTEKETRATVTTQMSNSYRALRVLMNMFRSIGIGVDENELLEKILDTLFEVFPDTDRGFIILRDPVTEELRPAAIRQPGGEPNNRLSISRTLLQYVLEKKQTVLTTDAMQDGRFQTSETIMDLELRSVMCAPLKHEDNVLGFISLDTQTVTDSYNKEALGMLAALANFASLAIANARLHNDLVLQERVEQELKNAHRIQYSFLPQEVPQLGTYSFAHRYTPAHQVGGDFYDYVPLPENQLGVAIGDVSGKGVPAALLMAKLTGNIRYLAASGLPPGELVKEVNKAMRQSGTDLFVTFLYIVIDSDSHKLTIANAAHCPPYIKSENGSIERIECEPGLPAGVLEGTEYEQTELEITAGDRICLYTDGIIEAMDDGKNPFGDERLAEALRQSGPRIAEIAENIEDSVVSFVGNAEQHDDMTLVCFGQDHIGQ